MAKVTRRSDSSEKKQTPVSVPRLQAGIRTIDAKIVQLLNQRAAIVKQLAEHRRGEGKPDVQLADEDRQLSDISAGATGPLSTATLQNIFREIISGCRSLVRPSRVAFLGPQYTYSHLAALHRFGSDVEFVPVGTIAAVFEEVLRGHSQYGLVPLENSTDGRIADTLDMFSRHPMRICGQVELMIHHALLARCPRTDIREVYSRPQALSQCRNWLSKHLPAARLVEVTSTSTAAQLAIEKPGAAAIAAVQAGIHYGLDVIAENIEDNPGNTTRFAIIGGEPSPRTGNDKTAIMFQLEHRPGALAEAMGIFKKNKLNLTWIESFPVPGTRGAYYFFIEIEGHGSELRVRKAIAGLQRKTLRLELLGSYPAVSLVGG